MTSNAFASCIAPTPQEWEDRRPQITQLYLNEDRPLKDVMTSVNVRGFKATEKMFKSRITKWNLDKNTKEREARTVLKMHAQRNGRPTKMLLRGQSVNINKIEKYFKRKGMTIEDVLSSECPSPSGMDLVCRSPSPATNLQTVDSIPVMATTMSIHTDAFQRHNMAISQVIPPRIEAPDELKITEYLFADIREYMIGVTKADRNVESSLILRTVGIYANACESMTPSTFVTTLRRDACNGSLGLLINIRQFISNRNFYHLCVVTRAIALTLLAEYGPSATRLTSARIFDSLGRLFKIGQRFALISKSLFNVVNDNLEFLISTGIIPTRYLKNNMVSFDGDCIRGGAPCNELKDFRPPDGRRTTLPCSPTTHHSTAR